MRRNSGFTLVELLIALAVTGVLLSVATPGFQSFMQGARQVTSYNKVASVLRFARSEAIKRSVAVSVCPRASNTTCGTDWSEGMLVYDDAMANGTPGVLDGTDSVVRVIKMNSAGVTVSASAIIRPQTSSSVQNSIRFNGRGQSNWANGTWLLCDGRGDKEARALIIGGAGISRRAHDTPTSNSIVVDASGVAVSC
ncbi:MAG: GspH/FimT family pseudopilin [Granulosicoccus sp.]